MDQYDPDAEGDKYHLQWNALSAWFLGPRAENRKLFNSLVQRTFLLHEKHRNEYFPTDPGYVTKFSKASRAYKSETKQLKERLTEMNTELSHSTPVFSPRFQGHMNWDITMPSYLGYISGMLWNPNNVDVTASPVTTPYEIIVGDQICDMIGFDRTLGYEPWGHITCGGSIANIEAMWSSRNLKFYSLSLQDTVNDPNNTDLTKAKDYPVLVLNPDDPDNRYVSHKLSECTVWQLLNIDVDEACKMAEGVALEAGVSMEHLSDLVHPHSYTSIGIAAFLNNRGINSPKCFCPATCHYSWPKAATVLGLGEDNLVLVNVDDKSRQDMTHLKSLLQDCVDKSVPVISVTAVLGSTEESAMDPLTDILDLRDEFRKKGLNFVICADAAWGAYMRTILIDPADPASCKGRKCKERARGVAPVLTFVPISPLSEHTTKNLNALRLADTVTSDPHKTGYCPYPAGGLSYRNGTMKEFVKLAAPEVFHSETDLSVGINGLEGSKPGAAAAGVLLSHRVIGLDKYGYGRILGQCVFGSKVWYCIWTHLAKATDPFVVSPILPSTAIQKKQMKDYIIGKTNVQIYKEDKAMELLRNVGPDALINKFGINLKVDGVLNDDVDESTDFSKKVGVILSVNADKDVKRVQMVIFQSMMEPDTYGSSLAKYQETIGLTKNTKNAFGCMVNTVMNPWQASSVYVSTLGEIFRQACFIAQGWKTDTASRHSFALCGIPQFSEKDGWYIFANLCAKFSAPADQYNAIVKFSILRENDAAEIRVQDRQLFVSNQDALVLYELLENKGRNEDGLMYDVFDNLSGISNKKSIPLKVLDVVNMKHFEPANDPDLVYPDAQTYLMFGDGDKVFLSHIVTKNPDFQQVVEAKLHEFPMQAEKDRLLIWYGIKVTFPDLPLDKQNPTSNPFQHPDCTYKISFAGRKHEKREMIITLKDNTGWYDTSFLASK